MLCRILQFKRSELKFRTIIYGRLDKVLIRACTVSTGMRYLMRCRTLSGIATSYWSKECSLTRLVSSSRSKGTTWCTFGLSSVASCSLFHVSSICSSHRYSSIPTEWLFYRIFTMHVQISKICSMNPIKKGKLIQIVPYFRLVILTKVEVVHPRSCRLFWMRYASTKELISH